MFKYLPRPHSQTAPEESKDLRTFDFISRALCTTFYDELPWNSSILQSKAKNPYDIELEYTCIFIKICIYI